ncbi:hypothetical protein HF638_17555 [Paenibacillus sp. SZ31]|uniref:hypothetical protein n=1 Tax=Paenibacillus sp. SZ31 TaxID=2725555 RepID=UPI001469F611|nr:hypothetical protein [Paenibacillus sp. SZ31]NMI05785.1 hypothetical protein [Paenibacillus sp. SZ31]
MDDRVMDQEQFAIVTIQGICFRNQYYSCREALKERWYEKAMIKGWMITISKYNVHEDKLILRASQNKPDIICSRINDVEVNTKNREAYFTQMQQLKRMPRRKRRRKDRNKL